MRFPPSFLDEIKARLPVSEVVRRRVQIKKQGREWKGLSPFSAEKTPSFFVNDQKQAWFDFSSGQNGSIFDFVMLTEGLSFPEAVERLAHDAGLALPTVSPESMQREKERASLHDIMEMAAKFFEAELQSPRGAKARGYLADRGIAPQTQRQFRMGYSPNDRFALRDHLAAKGATVEMMCETGLLVHGEDIAVPYDRFRDRVMFPICDRSGKVIAFGGRALEKDVPAKYLNSPETPLFHKGSTLYNHHNARKPAHDTGTVIAVEGYVDVVSMSVAGFPNVVAACGTALTPDQCDLLWKMSEEPILCFDGDKAGRKAAYRAIDTALPLLGPGRTFRFAFLPDGQDPDDLARSGGHDAVKQVLDAARPLVEVLWTREAEAQPLDTPERRAALQRRLGEITREIRDETLRGFYRQELDQRISTLFGRAAGAGQPRANARSGRPGQPFQRGRWSPGRDPARSGFASLPPSVGASIKTSALFTSGRLTFAPREALITLVSMTHPRIAERYADDLASLDFSGPEMDRLRNLLLACLADTDCDAATIRRTVDEAGFSGLRERIEAFAGLSKQWCVKQGAAERDVEEILRQALALHRRERALHKELKSAEIALGEDACEENLVRLRDIKAELATLDGREAAIEGFGAASGFSPTEP
jgi:DNA primase